MSEISGGGLHKASAAAERQKASNCSGSVMPPAAATTV
jgi:hypothetical protein